MLGEFFDLDFLDVIHFLLCFLDLPKLYNDDDFYQLRYYKHISVILFYSELLSYRFSTFLSFFMIKNFLTSLIPHHAFLYKLIY